MKNKIVSKSLVNYYISFSCCLLLIIACNTASKNKKNNTESKSSLDQNLPPDQLIVWRKPDSTQKQVDDWISKVENAGRSKSKTKRNVCGSCNNTLMLLTGPGIENFIQTHPATGSVTASTSSPATGEDGPVYYARNYRIIRKKPGKTPSSIVKLSPVVHSGEAVKIAVFDTGVDPNELSNFAFQPSSRSCLKGANSGWNFIENNRNYSDDEESKHGTIVTRFITDQVVKSGKIRVEILPVKTHDANGVSNLFNILCGFAYAQEMGVNIINASFGFYVPRRKFSPEDDPLDPNVLLLRKFVEHYLTKNKILLVTAAGNTDNINLKKTFEEHGMPYRFNDPRNLNQVSFYPASLARNPEFPNVIAVTTVFIENGKGSVSPDQNFSKNVVDIGVTADKVLEGQYVFRNLLLDNGETVEGSSFAAPIVTGILGANYHKIKSIINRKNFKKDDIWRMLGSQFVASNQTLLDKIKDGKVMTRLK